MELRRDWMIVFGKGLLFVLVSLLAISGGGWLGWDRGIVDKKVVCLLDRPGLLVQLDEAIRSGLEAKPVDKTSPLVNQARLFAQYLDPSKPPETGGRAEVKKAEPITKEPVRVPAVVTPKFSVLATSVHVQDSSQSMALIEEPGVGAHWICEGASVGHQVVASIKKGCVVVQNQRDEKDEEVLICREPKPNNRTPKRKDLSDKYQGWEGIARLRFDK